MRPVVHSQKHYVQYPIDQVNAGTTQPIVIVQGVESTIANADTEVVEGSLVKAIYFELWLQNQGNLGEAIVTISKNPLNNTGPTFAEMGALFTYTNKKNVFFTHQGLTSNDAISGPVVILRNWIKIPKTKQRIGLGDIISLSIANVSSSDLNRCGFATYKEYS